MTRRLPAVLAFMGFPGVIWAQSEFLEAGRALSERAQAEALIAIVLTVAVAGVAVYFALRHGKGLIDVGSAYWLENIKLVIACLIVWFTVSFGFGIVLADTLNGLRFFGFKLGFWFAQQGSIYTFLVLIFFYAWRMNQLDRKYDLRESDD